MSPEKSLNVVAFVVGTCDCLHVCIKYLSDDKILKSQTNGRFLAVTC